MESSTPASEPNHPAGRAEKKRRRRRGPSKAELKRQLRKLRSQQPSSNPFNNVEAFNGENEGLPAPATDQPESPSASATSSSTGKADFDELTREITDEAPAAIGAAPGEEAPAPEVLPPGESPLVTEAAVAANIQWPFFVLAKALKKPDLELLEYERAMFTKPVTDCINRYVPEWLKKTDHPELVLLGTVTLAYLMRVGMYEWAEKLWAKAQRKSQEEDSSEAATATAGSPASSGISGNPAPGKPIAPFRNWNERAESSSSTP